MNDLELLGWSSHFANLATPVELDLVARVAADLGDRYAVLGPDGERTAVARGALLESSRPAVGDWVVLEADRGPSLAIIGRVLERRSALVRKAPGATTEAQVMAANVDLVFVVQGLDGDFNLRRLERTATAVWESGASPVVLLNKLDLDADAAVHVDAAGAVLPGVPVHALCARDGRGLEPVHEVLRPGRTGVLVGSSGAGKSTLVNRLLGREAQTTRPVRADDSRGRHTTTARRLFRLPNGGLLIDGPGIRELQLWHDGGGLEDTFSDLAALASGCRFRDCRHEAEPGCAVVAAVAEGRLETGRLASFHKLRRELAAVERRHDALARKEESRRWKTIHRSLRVMEKARFRKG